MSNIKKRRVVNYSIKRRMQIRLLLRFILILLISSSVTSIIFYYYSSQEVGQTFKQFHVNARTFLDFLLPAVIISFFIGALIAVGIAMFFPIKMAGPLYRIERDLKDRLSEGDLSARFSVRNGDEFQDLVDALNETVSKLKTKVDRFKEAADELSALLSSHRASDPFSRRLSEVAKKISDSAREFK